MQEENIEKTNNNNTEVKKVKKEKRKGYKKLKLSTKITVILNISIIILAGIYAWMITDASIAENIEYTAKLVVTDSNVNVKLFVLQNGSYIEQGQAVDAPLLNIDKIEPGKSIKYRFDIENKTDVLAATKIVFSNITGDLDLLKEYIYIGSTNPTIFNYKLSDILEYDEENQVYYFNFIKYFKISSKSTESIYFSISLSEQATNEVQDTSLSIDKIMFLYP